jgi:hypothetical protein
MYGALQLLAGLYTLFILFYKVSYLTDCTTKSVVLFCIHCGLVNDAVSNAGSVALNNRMNKRRKWKQAVVT